MTLTALLLVNFFGVFCRSFQQLNVVQYRWKWIPPVSYMMQLQLLYNVGFAVLVDGWLMALLFVFFSGTGAWLGAFLGMWCHRRLG